VNKGDDAAHGGVSFITIDASTNQSAERDLVVGLGEPVGLATSDDTQFITGQANNRIVKVKLSAALSAAAPVASNDIFVNVSAPDLLAAAPGGMLYTKCGEHSLCRYSRTGETTVIAMDFDEPRGIAVDAVRKRLFIVDRARGNRVRTSAGISTAILSNEHAYTHFRPFVIFSDRLPAPRRTAKRRVAS